MRAREPFSSHCLCKHVSRSQGTCATWHMMAVRPRQSLGRRARTQISTRTRTSIDIEGPCFAWECATPDVSARRCSRALPPQHAHRPSHALRPQPAPLIRTMSVSGS
jgi:hypothetical protein